jgi:nucleoside-diphosphate-sugar epimerase
MVRWNSLRSPTDEINLRASVALAERARKAGVKSFVFASSCSMYGFAEDGLRTEESPLDPLTAYARWKAAAERDLSSLAEDDFLITSLRPGTACGMWAWIDHDVSARSANIDARCDLTRAVAYIAVRGHGKEQVMPLLRFRCKRVDAAVSFYKASSCIGAVKV